MKGKHFKNKNYKMLILSIFQTIFFIAIIVSILYIIKWHYDSKQNEKLQEKMSNVVIVENKENTETEYKIDFEQLKTINNQVIGWLKVKGTQVEYAVVQAENNNYYLKRNLEKRSNVGGWIFTDYKNKLDGTDKNIVIYGHNMKDNSMFGSLKNILTEDWYNNEENHIIDFITEQENYKYQVFSVYKIEKEDYYINTEFEGNEFKEFINIIKDRSIKNFNIDVSAEDDILTLSTCADNNKYRIVLHAKRIIE